MFEVMARINIKHIALFFFVKKCSRRSTRDNFCYLCAYYTKHIRTSSNVIDK